MTTKAPDMLLDIAHDWEDEYISAIFSGIVGDVNHDGGYHISYEDVMARLGGDYSTTRSCDHPPNMAKSLEEYASAIDMSMNTSDMKKCYSRVLAVYKDKSDPRRKYFNAFNGWDGVGDAKRIDFIANVIGYASPDHKSHCHSEMPRCYCTDVKAGQAWLSVFSGQTKDEWDMSAQDIAKGAWKTDGYIENDDFYWRKDSKKHDPAPGTPDNPTAPNDFIMGETAITEAATRANLAYETAQKAKAAAEEALEILKQGVPVPGLVTLTPESVEAVAQRTADIMAARLDS